MAFDTKLLEIIACPVCKGKLRFDKENSELIAQPLSWRIRLSMTFQYCLKMKRVNCHLMRYKSGIRSCYSCALRF